MISATAVEAIMLSRYGYWLESKAAPIRAEVAATVDVVVRALRDGEEQPWGDGSSKLRTYDDAADFIERKFTPASEPKRGPE